MTKSANPTGEPKLASWVSWAVLVASFGLSASTWIALAVLAGFTAHLTVFGVTARLAWLMPVAVDGYVVVALVLWMSPVPARIAVFAKRNTYGAAGIGIAAQSAYHLLFTLSTDNQLWRVVLAAIVGALPPTFAGLAVHMRALIRRESGNTAAPSTVNGTVLSTVDETVPSTEPQPTTTEVPDLTPEPESTPIPEQAPAPADPVIPSPVQVAARITPPPSILRPVPAPEPGTAARPTPTRTGTPTTSPAMLAPPATDFSVTEPGAAQLALPIVSPALLAKARDVARQYRTEHGTPITAGRLAVRLQVSSEQAAQLLAAMERGRNSPTPIPTVNGRRTEAAR